MIASKEAKRTMGFRARMTARLSTIKPTAGEVADVVPLYENYVARLVGALVDKHMSQAVLDRGWLAEHWSLRDHDPCDEPTLTLIERIIAAEPSAGRAPGAPFWPDNISTNDLAQALRRTRDPDAILLAGSMANGLFFPSDEDGKLSFHMSLYAGSGGEDGRRVSEEIERALGRWPLLACARIVSAERRVNADLHKAVIAIDAGKAHHELMTGWSRSAHQGSIDVDPRRDRVELVLPGADHQPALLQVPLDGEGLSQAFVQAIKEWRSYLGLRHWIALQALFSLQGKREGRVIWRLDDHLDALGVARTWRADRKNRASVAREIALLTKMQLVIYHPDGRVRARHSILMTASEIEVEHEGTWQLEGLELQMHPWLYNGVRDQKTGQLGKHWHPAPPELAKVDHDKFRYALVLGLILPIRWKWAWAKNGVDHVTFEARTLLELAGIEHSPHNAGRAWETLDRNLAELRRIGLLGHVEWEGEEHTLAAKVRLHPAEWLLDRTLEGLRPVEKDLLDATLPTKGADLTLWRKARGWTQADLAGRLKISERTVRNAETAPEKPLGRAVSKALRTHPEQLSEPPSSPGLTPTPLPTSS